MSIRQMDLFRGGESDKLARSSASNGWVHYHVQTGLYASTREPDCNWLKKKPTLFQFRKEDYQAIGVLPCFDFESYVKAHPEIDFGNFPDCESVRNVVYGTPREVIHYIDVPALENKKFFNTVRIAETERRWASIGHQANWWDGVASDAQITLGVDIVGHVDSLLVAPDSNTMFFEVCHHGTPIFRQSLLEVNGCKTLSFVLLIFDEDRLTYVEIPTWSQAPTWLNTECIVPVTTV